MNVTVEESCSRCSKVTKTEMTLEKANEIQSKKAGTDEKITELKSAILDLLSGDFEPDLIVIKKVPNGSDSKLADYDITILPDLCAGTNTGKGTRSCKQRVSALVEDIKLKPAPKKKKKATAAQPEEG